MNAFCKEFEHFFRITFGLVRSFLNRDGCALPLDLREGWLPPKLWRTGGCVNKRCKLKLFVLRDVPKERI